VSQWGVLGQVLAGEPSDRNRANVHALVEHAAALLTRVPETFRNYTLHDARHAENVVRLMGELAQPRLTSMETLEAALLILAAYFHDIGMVYTDAELAAVPATRDFEEFLDDDRPDEFLARAENDGVPPDWVIVAYCRSRHAVRVREHLRRVDQALLTWNGVSFARELELVCRSHNEGAERLHEPAFATPFLYKADLRICAVLLRLADILDLDSTRTPPAIYEHLGLSRRASPDDAVSDDEWRKHLCAQGFFFPPRRDQNYSLQFAASPEAPGVEHELRRFLGVIDEELLLCRGVRDACGEGWRELPLPGGIDTSLIHSTGYRYGEFRFELDRDSVLDLFAGEQLYGEPKAFLRELLQNAIDAVRLRVHLRDDAESDPPRVDVTCWDDKDGYVWVRIDDNGIGMDEAAVLKYFLRVGRSYYKSSEFKADLIRQGPRDGSFGVISRFGIGVLSCFMAGNEVEVSSLRIRPDRSLAKGVRLRLTRDQDYFVLQEEGDEAALMPTTSGTSDAFRSTPGTSVAVRIDPNRTGLDVATVLKAIESYVLAPPVTITANGRPIDRDGVQVVERWYRAAPFSVDVPPGTRRVDSGSVPYLGPLKLLVVPLDLGGHPEVPEVSGHLIAILAAESDDESCDADAFVGWPASDPAIAAARQFMAGSVVERRFEVESFGGLRDFSVHVSSRVRPAAVAAALDTIAWSGKVSDESEAATSDARAEDEARELANSPEKFGAMLKREVVPRNQISVSMMVALTVEPTEIRPAIDSRWPNEMGNAGNVPWSYNGIRIPDENTGEGIISFDAGKSQVFGSLVLRDRLRPDLTIARDRVQSFPVEVQSAALLAFHHAVRRLPSNRWTKTIDTLKRVNLYGVPTERKVPFERISAEPLIAGGAWLGVAIFETDFGLASIDEIRRRAGHGFTINLHGLEQASQWSSNLNFMELLRFTLIQRELDVRWSHGPTIGSLQPQIFGADRPIIDPGAELFAPLYAVRYAAETDIAFWRPTADSPALHRDSFLNDGHPLVRWLFAHAATLAADFAAPFQRVFFPGPLTWDKPETLNEALNMVARARPEIAPPPEAYLRELGDGRWVSR
jgi:hypothetical protein